MLEPARALTGLRLDSCDHRWQVHLPGLFFPQFYVVREAIFASPRPATPTEFADCAWSGLLTYKDNYVRAPHPSLPAPPPQK